MTGWRIGCCQSVCIFWIYYLGEPFTNRPVEKSRSAVIGTCIQKKKLSNTTHIFKGPNKLVYFSEGASAPTIYKQKIRDVFYYTRFITFSNSVYFTFIIGTRDETKVFLIFELYWHIFILQLFILYKSLGARKNSDITQSKKNLNCHNIRSPILISFRCSIFIHKSI